MPYRTPAENGIGIREEGSRENYVTATEGRGWGRGRGVGDKLLAIEESAQRETVHVKSRIRAQGVAELQMALFCRSLMQGKTTRMPYFE